MLPIDFARTVLSARASPLEEVGRVSEPFRSALCSDGATELDKAFKELDNWIMDLYCIGSHYLPGLHMGCLKICYLGGMRRW